jgi:hypothetical protein
MKVPTKNRSQKCLPETVRRVLTRSCEAWPLTPRPTEVAASGDPFS